VICNTTTCFNHNLEFQGGYEHSIETLLILNRPLIMNGNDNEPLCFLYQYVIQSDLEVVGGVGL